MTDIRTILRTAYQFGRDNGEGRSEKNFNDFMETSGAQELLSLAEEKQIKPTRITFDGKRINYSELSQQHLSNIIWFNQIFHKRNSPLEKEELNKRFDGERLPYKPSREFPQEIQLLKNMGCITEDDNLICYEGEVIGEVVDSFDDGK